MAVTRTETTTYDCDGPACSESTESPTNWISVDCLWADVATQTRFMEKHFHEEACLEAHLDT
jgi:hypothetical protein